MKTTYLGGTIMRKFLLASHGKFAEGIYNSLQIILGENINVSTICAYVNGKDDMESMVKSHINSLKREEELIVITDLFGGSVNNEFMKHIKNKQVHLVSGMNLHLLIEIITSQNPNTKEMINYAINQSKESIKYCTETIKLTEEVKCEEF